MITVRKAADRGLTKLPWLKSFHSFSFGDYRDPAHVGFGPLRVINDDLIAPGGGFHLHDHRDMEIVTFMITGRLAHEDSMGNRTTIGAGEVQTMSAGTGITHSEFNGSQTDPARLLQIWIMPAEKGLAPSYRQRAFDVAAKTDRLCPIAAGDGRGSALVLHQDTAIYASRLSPGGRVAFDAAAGRRVWIQMIEGGMEVNGAFLGPGDGAAIENEGSLAAVSAPGGEFLLFDLP
ncbi:MAG: pirin family protein [Alphaproteobacteria bacterium]